MPLKSLEKAREHRAKNVEHFRALNRKWNEANPEKVREMKRQYYLKNRERLIAKAKAQYDSDPKAWYEKVRDWKAKNPDKEKAYQEKWADTHKDQISKRMKRYTSQKYSEDPDKFRARAVSNYRKNKEKFRIKRKSVSVHRAAKLRLYNKKRIDLIQLGTSDSGDAQIVQLISQLKASPETKCFYCGVPLFGNAIHIDHIVPLSKGGAHCVSNLCASCPPCNLSKNDKTVDEWNQWKQNVESKALVRKES